MKEVSGEECIELMKEKFPRFLSYWKSYTREHGADNGLHIQMIPFEEYAIDTIKSNDQAGIKKIFDFVEFLLCNGDESVKDAIATSFLEYLMSKDPDEIQFIAFAKYTDYDSKMHLTKGNTRNLCSSKPIPIREKGAMHDEYKVRDVCACQMHF